jgi:hypothetical protein
VIGEQRREAIDVKAASDAPAGSLDDCERSGWGGTRCDVIREGATSRGCECVRESAAELILIAYILRGRNNVSYGGQEATRSIDIGVKCRCLVLSTLILVSKTCQLVTCQPATSGC